MNGRGKHTMENNEKSVKLTKLTECSGCGAKVGAGELAKLLQDLQVHKDPDLLVGFDKSDDAAVYRIHENLAMVQTLDFFPPIANDPYRFGAIAAANSLSDIYAMGGEPKVALNIMMVPEDMEKEDVHQILKGGYDKVYEAGALIVGGHSIYDKEPKYGLSVTGFVNPDRVLTNSGCKPGDRLIYTKPLGIGILATAAKAEMVEEDVLRSVEEIMMTLNKYARDIMVKYEVHACTDVTGFAMLGHMLEMAQGSNTEIHLDLHAVEKLLMPGVLEFAKLGILPASVYRNRRYASQQVMAKDASRAIQDVLYDPQTSGGLLIAVGENEADALLSELKSDKRVPTAEIVGEVREYRNGERIFLHNAQIAK